MECIALHCIARHTKHCLVCGQDALANASCPHTIQSKIGGLYLATSHENSEEINFGQLKMCKCSMKLEHSINWILSTFMVWSAIMLAHFEEMSFGQLKMCKCSRKLEHSIN